MGRDYIVFIRGLPWSANPEQVLKFLEGCSVRGGDSGIHFTCTRAGEPNGEAYVELETADDMLDALAKDKHYLGKRCIEVSRCTREEMEWVLERRGPGVQTQRNSDAVVRLRGLPYGCTKEEIAYFFSGLEIAPNGITQTIDEVGRIMGDAFVQFTSPEMAEKACDYHMKMIGKRYIEVFRSSLYSLNRWVGIVPQSQSTRGRGRPSKPVSSALSRGRPIHSSDEHGHTDEVNGSLRYHSRGRGLSQGRGRGTDQGYRGRGRGRGIAQGHRGRGRGRGTEQSRRQGQDSGSSARLADVGAISGHDASKSASYVSQTGFCVRMRGLPFSASEQDILDFFEPLNPVNVFVHYNDDGRATGGANVDFSSLEELTKALKRHNSTMQHRYIELFDDSTTAKGVHDDYNDEYDNSNYSWHSENDGANNYDNSYNCDSDNGDNSVDRNAQDERYSDSVDNSADRNAKDESYSNNSVYRYVQDPYNSDYGGNGDVNNNGFHADNKGNFDDYCDDDLYA